MASRRLHIVDEKLRAGHLRESLEELKRVYDPNVMADRVLMAELMIETDGQDKIRSLIGELVQRPGVEASVRARACTTLALALRRQNRISEGIQLHERAVRYASAAEDPKLLCQAKLFLLTAKFDLFGPTAVGTLPKEVWHNAISVGDPSLTVSIHCYFAGLEGRRGALDLARRHLDLAVHLIGNSDNPYLEGFICNNSTTLAAVSGDTLGALKYAERTLELTKRSGDRFTQISAVNNLCHISLMLGRLEDAERHLAMAERLVRKEPFLQMCLADSRAQIQLLTGRLEECETTLSALSAFVHSDEISQRSYAALEIMTTHFRLLRKQGRFDAALEVARAGAIASRERGIPVLEAVFNIHCADALIDLERLEDATRAIAQAARVMSLLSSDYLTVRAELERVRGRALAMRGDFEAARGRLDLSVRIHDASGQNIARNEAERCRDEDAAPQRTAQTAKGGSGRPTKSQRQLSDIEFAASLLVVSSRPDLLGALAHDLLAKSDVTEQLALLKYEKSKISVVRHHKWANATDVAHQVKAASQADAANDGSNDNVLCIGLGKHHDNTFELLIRPREDIVAAGRLAAIETVIRAAVAKEDARLERLERTSVWPTESEMDLAHAGPFLDSPRMLEVYREVKKAAPTDLMVLLTGETGVGKEILAREVHRMSARAHRMFQPVVCAGDC